MPRPRLAVPAVLLLVAGLALIGIYLVGSRDAAPGATANLTPTASSLSPATSTPTAAPTVTATETAQVAPAETPALTATRTLAPAVSPMPATTAPPVPTGTPTPAIASPPTPVAASSAAPSPPSTTPVAPPTSIAGTIPPLERFGMTVAHGDISGALTAGLPFGSYLTWRMASVSPASFPRFWQMVRVSQSGPKSSWEAIAGNVAAYPGSTWIVGNEPDVKWQDNVTPDQYARVYHDVYHFIKDRDPSARLVIGGVSQPSPLRRAYLDIVLETYQREYGEPMPVDIWNIHAFILREEAGAWGIDIPPGMSGAAGRLVEIQDHANLALLRQDIIDFRAWMAERGYGDRPLAVTEYGILLPSDYGFPHDVVAGFLTGSFDFFLSATAETGYAPDGWRLVQWWFWYSLDDLTDYPTGALFDPTTGTLTPLGQVFASYVKGH